MTVQQTARLSDTALASNPGTLSGTYAPQPVKWAEIPKPDGGGVRKLGIPMAQTAEGVSDKRMLKLIRAFLRAESWKAGW